ncbi:ABC-2 transporter permease [Dyella mobilis]|uniref:ABC-2 transporter permease n=1 Tax=Dyella mobilis TaxID=1849582 RepID=A0ABS2KIE2_9GAMM|nr:ABC-2 transporter permease [Dyella mobilis]MBM7130906.1 ABC-2 transporter permease [Dyella mobilis]GLQ97535.1 ABC transporter permease [Dyella mobilis]
MKTLYWLMKREYWEHRGGFLWAPAITATTLLAIALMSIIGGEIVGRRMGLFPLNDIPRGNDPLTPEQFQHVGTTLDGFLCFSAVVVLAVMAIVVFFYCLGSLYEDRKDRSILFWESLPISNWKTILSKVLSATVVAPVIATVIGVLFGLVLLALGLFYLMFHGFNAWHLLGAAHPIQVTFDIIALIPLYALCALPTIGWLMLCSASARSMPFLWALVIPLASNLIVWWLDVIGLLNLNASWYFQHITARLLFALPPVNWLEFSSKLHVHSPDHVTMLDQLGLAGNYAALAAPDAWIGIIVGGAMLVAAIWLRRWRNDA